MDTDCCAAGAPGLFSRLVLPACSPGDVVGEPRGCPVVMALAAGGDAMQSPDRFATHRESEAGSSGLTPGYLEG